MSKLKTLDFLQRQISGTLPENATTQFHYPTAISKFFGYRVCEIDSGTACLTLNVDPKVHGNQQGTIHGGLLAELADATMGTALSTLIDEGDSFTSIDLSIKFFRPVWTTTLHAYARPVKAGKTISHYTCEILNAKKKVVALATGTFMTLRGEAATGR